MLLQAKPSGICNCKLQPVFKFFFGAVVGEHEDIKACMGSGQPVADTSIRNAEKATEKLTEPECS